MMKKLLLLVFSFGTLAAKGQAVQQPHLSVELLSASEQVHAGETLLVGVRLKMEKGWHIYWRNPGDSGEQTRVSWNLPEGFQAGPVLWPAPSRIPVSPLVNFGYEDEVVLLTEILAGANSRSESDATLRADVNWLVCQEICIPGKAALEIKLPWTEETPTPSPESGSLSSRRNAIPSASAKWKTVAEVNDKRVRLTLNGNTEGVSGAEYYPFSETLIQNAAEQKIQITSNQLEIEVPRSSLGGESAINPEGLAGVIVLKGQTPTSFEVMPSLENAASGGYWEALLFAFLGGLILNLMPCVFPVLCLKVLSFAQMGGADKNKLIVHAGAYTLGILISFWALAGTLIALRAGGQALGWGFQLQSPGFLAALSFLLVALSLNLFGVFEVGGSWMGVGQKWAGKDGLVGAFFSGVLATVVATPCTAPFMGTAMGYALSQPAIFALGIFTSLGIGLASPYLLFSFSPALTNRLPRPGVWMVIFKQAMAFPLLLTALWLLSVLALQSSLETVFQIFVALIFFSAGLWIYGLGVSKSFFQIALASVFVLASLYWSFSELRRMPAKGAATQASGGWVPYSEEALQKARSKGQAVFIDFTAAWCITCQVNEHVALSVQSVRDKFAEKNVLLMKADWTNQDDAITKKLESFGRNGVPLYALYPEGLNGEPRLLPQILTPDIVLTALENMDK